MWTACRSRLKSIFPADTSICLCLLVGIFAMGSWIDINGLWVELPLLVKSLPEGWSLPSYIVIISQVANIGPLIYLSLHCILKTRLHTNIVIYLILGVGAVSCLLLSICWFYTINKRSIPFLTLTFLLSLVDCTSSVTFLPYMAHFPSQYMTALYVGEGFSGLLPSLVALVQGVGDEVKCVNSSQEVNGTLQFHQIPQYPPPRFSVSIFMAFLCVMLCLSCVCFGVIDCLPHWRRYRLSSSSVRPAFRRHGTEEEISSVTHTSFGKTTAIPKSTSLLLVQQGNESHNPTPQLQEMPPLPPQETNSENDSTANVIGGVGLPLRFHVRDGSVLAAYCLVTWLSLLGIGFLPSVQSFSAMGYSNYVYHLTATLAAISNPVACLVTFVWRVRHRIVWLVLVLAGTFMGVYITWVATRSRQAPLRDSGGGAIIILAWIGVTALLSFVKTCIALDLKTLGQGPLLLCGVCTQLGTLMGAVLAFLAINVARVFQSKSPCE